MSFEIKVLFLSLFLGLFQLLLAANLATKERGTKWNLSPRDDKLPELGKVAGRAQRAFQNFKETFSFFAVAVLILQIYQKNNSVSAVGAGIYFVARIGYIPLYLKGIPVFRTLTWMISMVGFLAVAITALL